MTIFHALAYSGIEGFVIVSPKESIASLGYFQELKTSINIDFCRKKNLKLIRREVGGGTTLLDCNQIFYQVVFKKDNKNIPQDTFELYKRLSQPVINTYKDLGIKVKYKEINDLITADGNKKISGEGGANIGDMKVFVGSIILDFDRELMSRLFPVQNEEYRLQLLKSLENNMSTVKDELGYIPPREDVIDMLVENFSEVLGSLKPEKLPKEVLEKARELEKVYTSDDFIAKKGKKETGIKIASGINMYQNSYKAVGGKIYSVFEIKDDVLNKVNIYGDFTFLPKEKINDMENSLIGQPLIKEILIKKIEEFIVNNKIDCPGVKSEDFASTLII